MTKKIGIFGPKNFQKLEKIKKNDFQKKCQVFLLKSVKSNGSWLNLDVEFVEF